MFCEIVLIVIKYETQRSRRLMSYVPVFLENHFKANLRERLRFTSPHTQFGTFPISLIKNEIRNIFKSVLLFSNSKISPDRPYGFVDYH